METDFEIREPILGSRCFSNYFLSFVLFFSGFSFFLVGFSSYFDIKIFPFLVIDNIAYIPQGILMLFYGTLGIIFGVYFFLNILWDIGGGYNEFSKKDELVRIIRKGFPGKNNVIFLSYSLSSIKTIEVNFKLGLNPRNNIFLVLYDKRKIPLYPSQNYLNISQVEQNAIKLANFLNVSIQNTSDL